MAYICDLGSGQVVYIENSGMQTDITLASSTAGQQQQASSSFHTGKWRIPPTAFRAASSVILRIDSESGQYFIQVQGSSTIVLNSPPSLVGAEELSLKQADAPSMKPIEPMKPMTPMKMSNMEMRMGNMSMQMGNSAPNAEHFCSQCGTKTAEGDRFCTSCGHRLQA